MVNARHKEVLKASTSKGAEPSASDADHGSSDNGSSSSSEDLNFRGFMDEETKVLSSMISRQVGKAIKNVMPYYINQTTENLKENVMCQNSMEHLIQLLVQDGFSPLKVYEKGEEWLGLCSWKDFKELFNAEYASAEEIDKIREEMLRDNIWEVISPFKCTTIEDPLSRARVREADLQRRKSKEVKDTKRKLEFRDRDAKKSKHDHGQKGGENQTKTSCEKCHKFHLGECRANLPGHKSNECPNPKAIEAKPLKSIKEEKVEKIEIDDSTFRMDFIPSMLGVFDIVIGMDWLDKYNATILCSQKLIWVINPQDREIIIYGNKRKDDFKLCSVMKARKYLSHGCYAFIAHVIDTTFEKKSVKDVLVINEFLDVFPEDFPGIPPERQVKFRIDLILGATPITKTLYRLAPSKMKELMSQLQELLDKGFICPSSSPWGALILFVKRRMVVCECASIIVI
ncbi:putative reverse transcriptase domain-containing protein [Tanacetum coccineum]